MINLETEPRFKEMMKCLGFKKTSRSFIKSSKDIILEMMFGYATKGEKHVRYYSGSYFIRYPQIETFGKKLEIDVFPLGGLMGYLMPPKSGLVEWRFTESDTEDYYLNVVNEIENAIKGYVLPFADKFSCITDFVYGAEMGVFHNCQYDHRAVAIAYYLLGDFPKCMLYMDKTLDFYASQSKNNEDAEFLKAIGVFDDDSNLTNNKNYINYKKFSDRMRECIDL